ncbi:MAG: hypothetical protein ACPG46_09900 [Thalassotalea sp.]
MKIFNSLLFFFLLVGCQTTEHKQINEDSFYTSAELLPNDIEYSPSFIFRYKDILNAEQKRVLWQVVKKDFDMLNKQELPLDYKERGKEIKNNQEFSFIGSVFSSSRTSNYVSGIIKYKDDNLFNNPKKFKLFVASVYDKKVIPAFNTISENFQFNFKCVYGCDDNSANKIYEFTSLNAEIPAKSQYLPNKLYASVCISNQNKIHRLNSNFYDENRIKKALFTNSNDGFNVVFNFLEKGTQADFSNSQNLVSNTKYNRHCLEHEGSINAFNYSRGRDFYRSISKSIPEYFATLNFENEYALYNGDIWKLSNLDDAKLFHGIKTIN